MAKVSTNISLDPKLKAAAQAFFEEIGIDMSTAVTLFFKQCVRKQRIPFDIGIDIPNEETRKAFAEYEEIKKDVNSVKYKRYDSLKEALKDLNYNVEGKTNK